MDCDEAYIATADEIDEIETNDRIKVGKIFVVVDAGKLILPYNAEAQLEGAVLFALSTSLRERITFKQGQVQETNFDNYHVLRMAETPELSYAFVDSERNPKGIWDIAGMGVAASLANAFTAIEGTRIRHLPLTFECSGIVNSAA